MARPTLDEIFAEPDEFGLLDVKPAPRGDPASRPVRDRPGTDGACHRRNEHVGCCCLGSTVGREGVRQRHETTQEAD